MRKIITALLLLPWLAWGANPQLGFNELSQNQAQPHLTINAADRAITGMLAGQLTFNMLTNANLTLANTQWQYGTIRITDTGPVLTAARDVIYPNVDSYTGGTSRATFYFVNSTAQTLTVKRSGQTGVAVTAGSAALLHHNGTDIEAIASGGGGSGAPDSATYITQTANASLSAEQALGALATGILKSTTTTGVLSIAAAGTDYYAPGGTDVAFADGGTGLSAASDDQTIVSSGSAWVAKTIPDCTDSGGNHINYTQSTNAFSCGTSGSGGGGSPGGSTTEVQFNNAGAFAGDSGLAYTSGTNTLTVGTTADTGEINGGSSTGSGVAGPAFVVRGGIGTAGNADGGLLSLLGGTAFGSATGGAVEIVAASSVVGGGITIQTGVGSSNQSGSIVLHARSSGSGSANDGGEITLQSNGVTRQKWTKYGELQIGGSGGTAGQVLTSNGTLTPPTWTTQLDTVRTITAAGAITGAATDRIICVNKTVGAASAVSLHASPATGFEYTIKDCKGDALTNNITITPAAGNIDGAGTYVINTNYGAVTLFYNGTAWFVKSDKL